METYDIEENPTRYRREGKRAARLKSELTYDKKRNHPDIWKDIAIILRGSVGQPWNDVYSHIKHVIEPKFHHLITDNLGTHLQTYLVQGKVCINTDCYGGYFRQDDVIDERYLPVERSHRDYYVHPTTGLLQRVVKQRRKRYKTEHVVITNYKKLGRYNVLRKIDGVWYRIWIDVIKHALADYITLIKKKDRYSYYTWKNSSQDYNGVVMSLHVEDAWIHGLEAEEKKACRDDKGALYHSVRRVSVPVYTKQLNSKELKQHGLKNDVMMKISNRKLNRAW